MFQLMKFGQTVLGKKLFGVLMKQTFYGQFVAGEVSLLRCVGQSVRSCFAGYGQDCSGHRQNEELWGEEYLGLQRGGGHHPGGG